MFASSTLCVFTQIVPALDAGEELEHSADTLAPDACCESIIGVICLGDQVVQVGIRHGDEDRAKDLLANDLHVVICIDDHGRLDEKACARRCFTPDDDLGAVLAARLDVPEHALLLGLRHERPDVHVGVER